MTMNAPMKNSPLTATDITAVFSLANKMQPKAQWGPLRRFTSRMMDGFVVLDPHSSGALYMIARDRSGQYVAQDDTGRNLATGNTIDDVLTPWRLD